MEIPDGFILAGGGSSRMGERKERLMFGGETFLRNAFDIASEAFGGNVTIVGDQIEAVNFANVIPDELPDGIPLNNKAAIIGFFTALKNARTEWTALFACDLPFVNKELLQRLWSFADEEFDAIVPVQPDGRLQPLCAFYRTEKCLPKVASAIKNGTWSLHRLMENINIRRVEFSAIDDLSGSEFFFQNINTPDDLRRAIESRSAG